MKKTIVTTLFAALFLNISLMAQTVDVTPPKNSIIGTKKETVKEKKLAPLPNIQEANVMWKKTITREIDFRQKINQPFYFPQHPLEDCRNFITVVYDAILSGDLIVYKVENNSDEMLTPMTVEEFEIANRKTGEGTIIKDGVEIANVKDFRDRMPDVTRLRIKEDWYFDKHLSQFLVRIIALCPLIVEEDGFSQVCWIPYEESRKIFAEAFVFNRQNASERRTYDEIFLKRYFDSYIVKEENVMDKYIADDLSGLNALYESERVKNDLIDFEQSLWEY